MSEARPQLVRAIGRWDLTAMVINGVIGAGIFGLPAKVHALIGSYGLLAYLACAAMVLLIVLCFAEVGSRFRGTGGPYLYAYEAFGPSVGFLTGWLLWLARVSSVAALGNLFLGYLGWFLPTVSSGWPRIATGAALVLTLGVVNALGVREATRVSNAFTIGKLVPLLLFVGIGLFAIEPGRLALGAPPPLADFSTVMLMLVFAFTGFEIAIIPGGEQKDPQRDVPFALVTALFAIATIYLGVQAVAIGTLPDLASSERPLADAALVFAGSGGATVIVLGALVSICGTMNVSALAAPRVLYAMAERGQMPAALGAVHERFRTPHVAIALTTLVMLVATLSSSFMALLVMSTLARLLYYACTCVALIVLRRRADAPAPLYRLPGGNAVAALALGLSVWLLLHGSWPEWRALLVAVAVAWVPYALITWRRR